LSQFIVIVFENAVNRGRKTSAAGTARGASRHFQLENASFRGRSTSDHGYIYLSNIYIYMHRELFLASHPEANWSPLEDPLFAHIGRYASDLFVRVLADFGRLLPRSQPPTQPLPSQQLKLPVDEVKFLLL